MRMLGECPDPFSHPEETAPRKYGQHGKTDVSDMLTPVPCGPNRTCLSCPPSIFTNTDRNFISQVLAARRAAWR